MNRRTVRAGNGVRTGGRKDLFRKARGEKIPARGSRW